MMLGLLLLFTVTKGLSLSELRFEIVGFAKMAGFFVSTGARWVSKKASKLLMCSGALVFPQSSVRAFRH